MREFKTRSDISAWLNQELHKHKGCEQARATVQYEMLAVAAARAAAKAQSEPRKDDS